MARPTTGPAGPVSVGLLAEVCEAVGALVAEVVSGAVVMAEVSGKVAVVTTVAEDEEAVVPDLAQAAAKTNSMISVKTRHSLLACFIFTALHPFLDEFRILTVILYFQHLTGGNWRAANQGQKPARSRWNEDCRRTCFTA